MSKFSKGFTINHCKNLKNEIKEMVHYYDTFYVFHKYIFLSKGKDVKHTFFTSLFMSYKICPLDSMIQPTPRNYLYF